MSDRDEWQPISGMPMHRLVLVSDGALVKPATRVGPETIAAPVLMQMRLWTHWCPLPPPPKGDGE